MAVEAALAIPIFIFAILTVYVYFTALSTHTKLVMEQREKGKKICIYANLYESFLGVGDTVSLTESRQVSPISPTLLISEYRVWATFYAHAWTGYDISGNSGAAEEEEYVYITPEGSVYHKDINCYHLRLSIKYFLIVLIPKAYLQMEPSPEFRGNIPPAEYYGSREKYDADHQQT